MKITKHHYIENKMVPRGASRNNLNSIWPVEIGTLLKPESPMKACCCAIFG